MVTVCSHGLGNPPIVMLPKTLWFNQLAMARMEIIPSAGTFADGSATGNSGEAFKMGWLHPATSTESDIPTVDPLNSFNFHMLSFSFDEAVELRMQLQFKVLPKAQFTLFGARVSCPKSRHTQKHQSQLARVSSHRNIKK